MSFNSTATGSYVRCPSCHKIINDFGLSEPSKPCPECGDTCGHNSEHSSREGWPPTPIWFLFNSIDEQASVELEYQAARIVLACIVVELLIEDNLWKCLDLKEVKYEIAELLLSEAQGVDRRMRLFRRLNGQKLRKTLEELGHEDWFKNWHSKNDGNWEELGLKTIRNRILHQGTTIRKGNSALVKMESVLGGCLDVFQSLNNWVVQRHTK